MACSQQTFNNGAEDNVLAVEPAETKVRIQVNDVRGHDANHAVLTVQRKNWEPLVLGPALAMERTPGPVCLSVKFSSANFSP